MKEVSKTGHFKIDLPSSDAATALSGPGNSFLKKFESLTGVSLTIRGLQLEMNGVISKIERPSIAIGKAKLEKEKLAKAKTQVEENESSKAESDSSEAKS